MLNDKAFTFPQIYQQFCYFLETVSDDTSLSVSRGRVLTYIGNEFGGLISSRCCHKKIGRMFYRTKSDPFALLSHALGMPENNVQVKVTADYLNKKVRDLSERMIAEHRENPVLASNFDLAMESFSESVDDELWDFMHLLTQSMNESRGRSDILSAASHTKKVR